MVLPVLRTSLVGWVYNLKVTSALWVQCPLRLDIPLDHIENNILNESFVFTVW